MGAKGSKKKGKKSSSIGTLRVLILGNAGSGKSTFAKQMKLIHGGFTKAEMDQYRTILRQNLLQGLQEVIKTSEKNDQPISPANRKKARFFTEHDSFTVTWNAPLIEKAKTIWNEPAIVSIWERASSIPLTVTHLDYLMEHIEQITSKDFIPSNDEILLARQRTTGAFTTTFIRDQYTWNMVDVGGQRPERTKWEMIMKEDELSAVIFIVALDEYNVLSVDDGASKLEVSIGLFKEVVEGVKETNGTVVLFLNKMDVFIKKLKDDGLFQEFCRAFPDYQGDANAEKCAEFIYRRFLDECGEEAEEMEIHYHCTCALDTEAMGSVFNAVTKDLYVQRLANYSSKMVV